MLYTFFAYATMYNINDLHEVFYMARVIMIGCRKGGVTKTTTTVNLAHELSILKKRVLLIDFDSQGDSTKFYQESETEFFLGDVLLDRKFDIQKAVYSAVVDGTVSEYLDIIPARTGDVMAKLDMDMISLTRREERLKFQLDKIKDNYDFILIDTTPGTSVLTLNAVMAADEYIFPTEFKQHSLDGVETLLEYIADVKFIDEEEIKFRVVPSKVNKSAKNALEFGTSYLSTRWPNNTAKTIIYDRVAFAEAEAEHKPMSVLSKSHVASMYYKNLAREVIDNA